MALTYSAKVGVTSTSSSCAGRLVHNSFGEIEVERRRMFARKSCA